MTDTIDRPPRKRLGLDPDITSLSDLGLAVAELSYLASREKTVRAACDQQIRLAKHTAEQKLHVSVQGEAVSFSARRAALEAAIEVWCEENRDVVLADSGKTRKLTHGSVAWKNQPLKIEFVEGHDKEALMQLIDDQVETDDATVLQFLLRQLKRIKVTEKLSAYDLLDVKLSLSKRAVLERIKNQSLTDDDLAEVGLEAVAGEKMILKISDYFVDAEAA